MADRSDAGSPGDPPRNGSSDDSESEGVLVYEVTEAEAGLRLDAALASLSGVSRSQLQRWIEADRVTVDGDVTRQAARVSTGAILEASPPPTQTSEVLAEAIPLDVLHEDDDIIVLDKRAGMVVHPAPGHASGTLVNALLHHCRVEGNLATVGGVERPGIVHRLDKGTSGVMVVARNDAAHQSLARQFYDHSIERIYQAFVRALPGAESGRIDRPIGRHPTDRKRMSVRTRSGRAAATNWTIAERFPASGVCLLEIHPETGRTHQIRVHLSSAGLPIAGDPVYGRSRSDSAQGADLGRPALHAAVLGFDHPDGRGRMRFEAPLPADLEGFRDALRRSELEENDA